MLIPPSMFDEYDRRSQERRTQALREVRAKFPRLIEGSSGWYRAVRNRLNRIKGLKSTWDKQSSGVPTNSGQRRHSSALPRSARSVNEKKPRRRRLK